MKETYPIILSKAENGYIVDIPDFKANTEGYDLTDAIEMARDAIGLLGITNEDQGEEIPEPSSIEEAKKQIEFEDDIVTLVDVDFADYRRKNELRTVKKNCTLPSWLCYEAEKANINFSQVLQSALKEKLGIDR